MSSKHNPWRMTILGAVAVAILAGCSREEAPETVAEQAPPAEAAEHKAIVTEALEPYECGTITRLHTLGGVFLASQPAPEDFEQAKQGGVKSVINLRHEEEIDFNEPEVVSQLGLAYRNAPWNGPDELTGETIDEVRELLRSLERPILMHCSSGNRVGAMWLAYRVLDNGVPYDEALAEAKTVGMKSPDFERIVKEYIEEVSQEEDAS